MKKILSIFLLLSLIFLYGCSTTTTLTTQQVVTGENKIFSFSEEFPRSIGEKAMIKNAFNEPQIKLFFQDEKKPVIIGQVGAVRLEDDSMGYQFTINGNQDFNLFVNSKVTSNMKNENIEVIKCTAGEVCPQTGGNYQNEKTEEVMPTIVTDIIIVNGEKKTVIKGQDGDRVEKVKKGP